jgi:hypothetical protein
VEFEYWRHLTNNIGFLDAYFPVDISEESKKILHDAYGLRYRFGPEKLAYRRRPIRGWLHGTRVFEGQDAVVIRFWHFWCSQESERHFRVTEGVVDPEQEYYLGIHKQFMANLEKAGVLGILEFHCSLVVMNNYYTGPRGIRGEEEEEEEEQLSDDDPTDEKTTEPTLEQSEQGVKG